MTRTGYPIVTDVPRVLAITKIVDAFGLPMPRSTSLMDFRDRLHASARASWVMCFFRRIVFRALPISNNDLLKTCKAGSDTRIRMDASTSSTTLSIACLATLTGSSKNSRFPTNLKALSATCTCCSRAWGSVHSRLCAITNAPGTNTDPESRNSGASSVVWPIFTSPGILAWVRAYMNPVCPRPCIRAPLNRPHGNGTQRLLCQLIILAIMGYMLSGCADEKSVAVQPVSIKSESFCEVMRGVLPPTGKPTWDIVDSKPTITDARRIGAAVDKRCNKPSTPTPTS
jgi:hypothetical protein